jgi:hypothetical protein
MNERLGQGQKEGWMGIGRRGFLGVAGATLVDIWPALAQRGGPNACLTRGIPSRMSGPVEVLYKAPHGQPNGLAQGPNPGELWVQDRGVGRQVTLIHAKDGSVIREITADAIGPSGLVMDDDGIMWTADTHGVMLVSFDANDGHTIAKYFVPGACRMFEKAGDAPHRTSNLKPAQWGTICPTTRAMIPALILVQEKCSQALHIFGAPLDQRAFFPKEICFSIPVCRRDRFSPSISEAGLCKMFGQRPVPARWACAGPTLVAQVFGAPKPT